jgi:hypothetical protein
MDARKASSVGENSMLFNGEKIDAFSYLLKVSSHTSSDWEGAKWNLSQGFVCVDLSKLV